MVAGCYATFKETKHHELHKMRAAFEDRHKEIERLMNNADVMENFEQRDLYKGELKELEEEIRMIGKEDVDGEKIEAIENEIRKIREKIEDLFR